MSHPKPTFQFIAISRILTSSLVFPVFFGKELKLPMENDQTNFKTNVRMYTLGRCKINILKSVGRNAREYKLRIDCFYIHFLTCFVILQCIQFGGLKRKPCLLVAESYAHF